MLSWASGCLAGLPLPCLRGSAASASSASYSPSRARSREPLAGGGERKGASKGDEGAAAEKKPCIACGGQGCGICKLSDSELSRQFSNLASHQKAYLCGFFPAREEVVQALCDCPHLRDEVSKLKQAGGSGCKDCLVDLGCGDGRVVTEVVQQLGCSCIGVEMDDSLVDRAEQVVGSLPEGQRRLVSFIREDFRHISLADAFAVFIFLPPHVSEFVIREVLPESSLRSGTLVYVCSRKTWRPSLELDDDSGDEAAAAGPWCRRLATYVTGNDSFSTLHCFEWRLPQTDPGQTSWLAGLFGRRSG